MLISTIIAPTDALQIHRPQRPETARFDALDSAVLYHLQMQGRYGLPIWQLVNDVAAAQNPGCRDDARSIRLQLLKRLKRLLQIRMIFRFGRHAVSVVQLPRLSVKPGRRSPPGSTVSGRHILTQSFRAKTLENTSQNGIPGTKPDSVAIKQTESAMLVKSHSQSIAAMPSSAIAPERHKDTVEQIRNAAMALSQLPRQPKRKWSGYVNGTRIWRDRRILLPNGSPVFCYGARRGQVVWTTHPGKLVGGFCGEPLEWGVLPQDLISLLKNEAAATLGRLKFGRKERSSELKKQIARANGAKPCRGGRRRGRPAKVQTS